MLVELPRKSNWYGYCNMHDYVPKTSYFPSMYMAMGKGLDEVKNLIEGILNTNPSYEAFTELVLVVNLISWDMYGLYEESKEPKYKAIGEYFADEFYRIRDIFYERYDSEEARTYFWEMTD